MKARIKNQQTKENAKYYETPRNVFTNHINPRTQTINTESITLSLLTLLTYES